ITGVNDILRFDVRHFLKKMAEPVQERYLIQEGELMPLLCHKVYHVNLIARYKTVQPGINKENRHLRLILDQDGIRRLEKVPHV
ncbi:MAG: hypothetical protein KC445_05450, partial [Anaerolineales bacterium]|nr:hypothetical protein [Anaerolineales bacterium]